MKRLLTLALTLIMLFAFASCGSSAPVSAPAEEAPAAPAEENVPADDAAAPDEVAFDTITLTGVTAFSTNDTDGKIIAKFGEILSDLTGGAVTVDIYYSGSYCSIMEEFDYIMSGDIDFGIPKPVFGVTAMPLNYGLFSTTSIQDSFDQANYIALENPDTAEMIAEQCAANNIVMLGHTVNGASCFLSNNDISTWDKVMSQTVGSPINLDAYSAMGAGTAQVETVDMYDSLSRGVCDVIAYSTGDVLGSKLYEVGKNYGDQLTYTTSGVLVMNLDKFNSLNEATQNAIREAALQAGQWSVENAVKDYSDLKEVIESNGGTWTVYTEEETAQFHDILNQSDTALLRMFAANAGCGEEMETIIQARCAAEGVDYIAP